MRGYDGLVDVFEDGHGGVGVVGVGSQGLLVGDGDYFAEGPEDGGDELAEGGEGPGALDQVCAGVFAGIAIFVHAAHGGCEGGVSWV